MSSCDHAPVCTCFAANAVQGERLDKIVTRLAYSLSLSEAFLKVDYMSTRWSLDNSDSGRGGDRERLCGGFVQTVDS